MYHPDVVCGLLPHAETEETVHDLEAHGVLPEEIVVSRPQPGRYELADEYLHDDARGASRGALLGGAAGALLGLVAGTAIEAATAFGLIGWLVVAFGGAGFGALVGGMYGLQENDRPDDDPRRYRDLDDTTGWDLVVVNCKHWRNRAHEILMRHGAAILEESQPAPR